MTSPPPDARPDDEPRAAGPEDAPHKVAAPEGTPPLGTWARAYTAVVIILAVEIAVFLAIAGSFG